MKDLLLGILNEAVEACKKAKTNIELNELKAYYLGKKSPLSDIMKKMGGLSIEAKKEIGTLANQVKVKIEESISNVRCAIEEKEIQKKLESEKIDVTLPGKTFNLGTTHPLTKTVEMLQELFLGMGYTIAEGPEVELDVFNFELLNVPKGHPARDMQDSFYISDNILLRTQTSPVQARTMLAMNGKPIKIVCPGKVFRRDDDDATHSHQFMQCEGLVVDKNITMSDLKGTLLIIAKKMFGEEREIRFRPSYFPFTEPSVEVDVSCFKCGGKGCNLCKGNGWIEVLGAGMVHPNVLKDCGYDPEVYRGFAFGIGIERLTMLKLGIDDIRQFYINDRRFLNQFKGDR